MFFNHWDSMQTPELFLDCSPHKMYGHVILAEDSSCERFRVLRWDFLISATLVLADPPSDAEVIRGTWRLNLCQLERQKGRFGSVFPTFMVVDAKAMTYRNIPRDLSTRSSGEALES